MIIISIESANKHSDLQKQTDLLSKNAEYMKNFASISICQRSCSLPNSVFALIDKQLSDKLGQSNGNIKDLKLQRWEDEIKRSFYGELNLGKACSISQNIVLNARMGRLNQYLRRLTKSLNKISVQELSREKSDILVRHLTYFFEMEEEYQSAVLDLGLSILCRSYAPNSKVELYICRELLTQLRDIKLTELLELELNVFHLTKKALEKQLETIKMLGKACCQDQENKVSKVRTKIIEITNIKKQQEKFAGKSVEPCRKTRIAPAKRAEKQSTTVGAQS